MAQDEITFRVGIPQDSESQQDSPLDSTPSGLPNFVHGAQDFAAQQACESTTAFRASRADFWGTAAQARPSDLQ